MRLDHERVRWHRDRLGWTLDTLAEKAEVAKGTVLRAEHGEDVRPSSGRRIANALGTEISELIPDKPGRVGELAAPLADPPEAGHAIVGVGTTPEEAAEHLEQQRYAPTKIARDWDQLAQLFSDELEKVEKGDSSAGSLETLIDMLEYVALGMEALAAAEKRELRADYDDEDTARSRAVLRPAIDRLSVLVGDALRKIDREQLEIKAESAGKLKRLKHHFKRAS
jgi:transcriptional regulator with XRE-family HTH domain